MEAAKDDAEYYRRRAAMQAEWAANARDAKVRAVHDELVAMYEKRSRARPDESGSALIT